MGPTELQERIDDVNSQIGDLAIQHNALCEDLIKAKAEEKSALEPKRYRPTLAMLDKIWGDCFDEHGGICEYPQARIQAHRVSAIAVLEAVFEEWAESESTIDIFRDFKNIACKYLAEYKAER